MKSPAKPRRIRSRIVVPTPSAKEWYGQGIPWVKLERLNGKLIVVEGADGSGRSTQIVRLVEWLESGVHATVQVGLEEKGQIGQGSEAVDAPDPLRRTTAHDVPGVGGEDITITQDQVARPDQRH